jgi:ribosomal protein S18 acetylase RimI-like enzyme
MSPDNLRLREATAADLDTLVRLEQEVIAAERPFDSAIRESGARYYELDRLLADPATHLLVGEVDGRVIATGYAQLRASDPAFRHRRHAYLGFMYVAAEYRGHGINRAVVDALVEWGRSKGIQDFHLEVYAANASAIRAYEKAGFRRLMLKMKLGPD